MFMVINTKDGPKFFMGAVAPGAEIAFESTYPSTIGYSVSLGPMPIPPNGNIEKDVPRTHKAPMLPGHYTITFKSGKHDFEVSLEVASCGTAQPLFRFSEDSGATVDPKPFTVALVAGMWVIGKNVRPEIENYSGSTLRITATNGVGGKSSVHSVKPGRSRPELLRDNTFSDGSSIILHVDVPENPSERPGEIRFGTLQTGGTGLGEIILIP